ncbi:MAG: ROK family protein [Actinomycetales bacterium]|nr:ROK family protein [Actinomycetales bacterium]
MTDAHVDRHVFVRQHNESRILAAISAEAEPVSRVAIAAATGLSKPTVNALVDELLSTGLLREAGIRTGSIGRPASLVQLNPEAGMVLALAFDGDGIGAVIADITGDQRARQHAPLPRPDRLISGTAALVDEVLQQAGVDADAVRAISISAPGILEPGSDHRALAQNVPGLDDRALHRLLGRRFDASIAFENDVNLAAIAEHRYGIARGADDFVFLLVDTGVGMGLMLNGELLRGSRGAAGEAGYLPLGSARLVGPVARIGALESQAGLSGLLARYRAERTERGLAAGRPTLEAFLRALQEAEPAAVATAQQEAELIARAILAVCVLVDPQFVVLAGRIGSVPFVLDGVRRELARVAPYPIKVHESSLHGSAAIMGAVARGMQVARASIGLPES